MGMLARAAARPYVVNSSFPVSLPYLGQEILIEEFIHVVIGLPMPFGTRQGVVHIFGPRVDDALPARVGCECDLCTGEGFLGTVAELAGGDGEGADVVHHVIQLFARYIHQHQQGFDRVGHRHEGNLCILAYKAGIWFSLGRGVQHLGAVVTRPAAGEGKGGDQAGETDGAKVQHVRRGFIQMFLTKIFAVIYPELFTVQLVAPIHRGRRVVVVFADAARAAGITGYYRTPALNTHPLFIDALTGMIAERARALGWIAGDAEAARMAAAGVA